MRLLLRLIILPIAIFAQNGFEISHDTEVQSGYAARITISAPAELLPTTVTLNLNSRTYGRETMSVRLTESKTDVTLRPLSGDEYELSLSGEALGKNTTPKRSTIAFKNILAKFAVVTPASAVGGTFFSVTVRALDASDSLVTNYTGPLLLTTSGAESFTPTVIRDSLFQSGTAGEATFLFAYEGNGSITITATDSAQPIFTGTSDAIDISTPADRFEIEIPDIENLIVGTPFDVIIRAKDASDSTLTTFEGDIQIGTTFSGISNLPTSATFSLSDNGEKTFSNVTITVADTGRIYATALGTNSLVAYYDFEDRVTDRAFGANDGTNNNVTYTDANVPGRSIGKAGDFNGTSSYVSVPDNDDLRFNNYTLMAWIKMDATQNETQSSIFSKGHRTDGINNQAVIANVSGVPDDLRHRVQTSSTLNNGENGYNAATWTDWNHVAIRMDGGTITNWVNGVLVDGPTVLESDQVPNFDDFHIGREASAAQTGRYYFNGLIDEVTVYNFALPDSQITNNYTNTDPYEIFESVSPEMVVSPSTALADVVIEVSDSEFFNGVPFEVTVRGVDQYGNTIANYSGPVLLSTSGIGSLSQTSIRDSLFINGTPGEATVFLTYDGSGSITITATDSIDGSYASSTASLNFQSVAEYFEIDITNPQDLNAGQGFDVTIRAKNKSDITITTFEGEIQIGSTFSSVTNLPSSYTFTLGDNGVVTFSNVTITEADTGYIYANAIGTNSLVAYYDFEDRVSDQAFGQNNGTNVNVDYENGNISDQDSTLTDLGKAGRFDGTSSYIQIPDASDLRLNSYTISAWVKMDVTQNENQSTVFSKGSRTNGINNLLTIDNTGGDMRHRTQTSTTLNNGINGYVTDFTQWRLLTIRNDNGILTNWVDGVLVDGPSAVESAQVPNSDPFHIGRESDNSGNTGDYFAGLIDEVKIYNYALPDSIIQDDYLNPDPIAPLVSKSQQMIVAPSSILFGLEIEIEGSEFFNGVPFRVTVRGVDQFGNTLPNYTGPVNLTVNGGPDSLSVTTFRSDQFAATSDTEAGEASRFLSYNAGATISITATDSSNPSFTVASNEITVNNVADAFAVDVITGEVIQGQPFSIRIAALDAVGDTLTSFTGNAQIASTFSTLSGLPSEVTFTGTDNGTKVISGLTISSLETGNFYVSTTGTNTIVGYYTFENTGNDVGFSSNNATNNGATFESGNVQDADGTNRSFGNAARFDGNSFFEIPDATDLRLNNYTIMAWVRPENGTTTPAQQMVLGKGARNQVPANNNWLLFDFDPANQMFRHRTSGTDGANIGLNVQNVTVDAWTHFTIRLDGPVASNIQNGGTTNTGGTLSTATLSAGQEPVAASTYIGRAVAENNYGFEGLIDEVVIYNFPLTDQQIDQVYEGASPFSVLASASDTIQVRALTHSFASTVTAGVQDTVTIYQPYSGYSETLTFSSSDDSLTVGDQLLNTDSIKVPVRFKTAGYQTLVFTDGTLSDTVRVLVNATAQAGFFVNPENKAFSADGSYDLTITAVDTFNNVVKSYSDTVSLSASFPALINIPAVAVITPTDSGTVTLVDSLTFNGSSGTERTISATDGIYSGTSRGFTIATAGNPERYEVIVKLDTVRAGATDTLIVRALDGGDALVSSYFSTYDIATSVTGVNTLPATGDVVNGVDTILFTIDEPQTYSITVTDQGNTDINGSISNLVVLPNELREIEFSIASTRLKSGETTSITMTLKDSLGNTKTDFTGDVTLNSSASYSDKRMVAYFNFEGTTADQVGGHSVSDNNITFETGNTAENLGQAARFDGTTSFVEMTDAADLQLTTYTISAWVKADATQQEAQSTVFSKGHRTDGINNMAVFGNVAASPYTAGDLRHRVQTSTNLNNGENGYSSADWTDWNHIVIRMESDGTITNWVNGVRIDGPNQLESVQVPNTDPFNIGRERSDAQAARYYFAGLIDEVKVFNYALSDAEIAAETFSPLLYPIKLSFTGADAGQKTATVGFDLLGQTNIVATSGSITDSLTNGPVVVTPDDITVSISDTVLVGDSVDITVSLLSVGDSITAKSISGTTISFSSTDGSAILPSDYTDFSAANSSGTVTLTDGVVFNTIGSQTLTVTNSEGASVETTVVVQSNAEPTQFDVQISSATVLAGNTFSVTVTAKDVGNNTVATYTGSIDITGTDSNGTVATTTYDFELADAGTKTFTGFDFKTAGLQSITVSDQLDNDITGSDTVTVLANVPAQITIDNLTSNVTIGATYDPTITVRDQYDNVSTSYIGTIQLQTDDTLATRNYSLGDAGAYTFTGITFSGTPNVPQNVIAIETTGEGFRDTLVVTPRSSGTVTDYMVTFPASVTAGQSNSMTIVAVDGFGTEVTSYSGTAVITTSSDSSIFAGSNEIDFSAIDGDTTLTNYFQLMTSGSQTITLTDTANDLSTVVNVTVNPATVDTAILTLETASLYVNGQSYDLTVELLDEFGNRATNADSTISFSGTNIAAIGDYTFTLGNAGIVTLTDSVTFTSDGTAAVNVSSQDGSSFSGTLNNINVSASTVVTSFVVSGYPDPTTAGSTGSITISARNAENQVITTFADTVLLTSSDPAIQNLPDTVFFNGTEGGDTTLTNIEFRTVGNHFIDAELRSNADVDGRQSGITVTPGTLDSIVIAMSETRLKSGEIAPVDVTLYDGFDNVKTDFVGNLTLSSDEDVSVTNTQYSIQQTTNNQNAKILHYLTIQDLPSDGGSYDEFADGATSASFRPIAGYTSTFDGETYTWAKESDADGHFDYSSGNNLFKNSVVYVYSNTPQAVDIAISSEDGHSLYVNGSNVGFSTTQGGTQDNRGFLYDVNLNEGWNTLLLSVRNSDNTTWYASMAIYQDGLAGTQAYSTGTAATDLIYTNDYPTLIPSTDRTVAIVSSDLGTKSIDVSFLELGSGRTLQVSQGAVNSNTLNVDVTPAFFTITTDSAVTASTDFSATVSQLRYNRASDINLVPSETVTLSTSDDNVAVVLPGGHTFTAPDNGSHTFTGIQLATQGTQVLRVSDGDVTDSVSIVVESNLDATKFAVAVSNSQPLAGNLVSITITAQDDGGNNVSTYTGTINVTTTDAGATVTTPVTFDISDGGIKTLTNQQFTTAGTQIITIVDTNDISITGADTILVRPGEVDDLTIDGLTTNITIGETYNPIVSARDQYGNVATNYSGSVILRANDSGYADTLAYTIQNAGQQTFSGLVFSGTVDTQQDVIAVDFNNNLRRDTVTVTLRNPGTVTDLNPVLGAGVDTLTAGVTLDLTLTAVDGGLNEVPGYAGTVTVTSSADSSALTAPIDFSGIDGDTTVTNAITLFTAGDQTITFTDAANSLQRTVNVYVRPAAVDTAILTLESSSQYIVNQLYDLTIELRDVYGNTAIFADSTVTLTNSLGTIQSPVTFTVGDAGIITITDTVRFTTDGSATISATSQDGSSFSGSISGITVNPEASINDFTVTGYPDPVNAGTSGSITITALDGSASVFKSFTGTVELISSDGNIQNLPSTVTFTGPDSGVVTVSSIEFRTTGQHYIEARLQGNAAINGRQSNISVLPDSVNSFDFTVSDSRIVSGDLLDLGITLKDQFNNTVTDYVGDITLSSEELASIPLTTYSFGISGDDKAKIKNFLVVSGIPNADGDFVDGITDADAHAIEGATATLNGSSYTWAKQTSANGYFTASPGANTFRNMVVYVYSASAKDVDFAVSANDNHILYVNGSQVGTGAVDGSQTTYGALYEDVALNKGWNTVVFSVSTVDADLFYSLAIYQVNTKTNSQYTDGTPADVTYTNDSPFLVPNSGKSVSFVSSDFGQKTVTVSLSRTGSRTLTASRLGQSTSTSAIDVTPKRLELLSLPSTIDAGTDFSALLNFYDVLNDTAKFSPGSLNLTLTSSDTGATLPTVRAITSSDSGSVLFNNELTFITAGKQLITATLDNTEEQITVTSDSITVDVSNQVTNLLVSTTAGLKQSGNYYDLTITARDAGNNTVSNYTGTVSIITTDTSSLVELPNGGSYTFQPADNGTVTFSNALRLITSGTTTITVTDDTLTYITGEKTETVLPAAVERFELTTPSLTVTQGANFDLTLTAKDTFNNTVTSYIDQIVLIRDTAVVNLPDTVHDLISGNLGTYTFPGNSISGTGQFQIIGKDSAVASGITPDTLTLTVVPINDVSAYEFVALTDTLIAGVNYADTLNAVNGFGTLITSYTDTTAIFSSDAADLIISDSTINFTNGKGVIDLLNFTQVGNKTITVRDSVNSSLNIVRNIYVKNGPATTFAITLPNDTLVTDGAYNFTIEAQDVNGNRAIDYTGTVNITTSNANSTIVSSYTFSAGDQGQRTFTGGVTYNVASSNTTITITDNSNGSITGTSDPFEVEGTPLTLVSFEPLSGYNNSVFTTVNLVDTPMFVFTVNNPSDSILVISQINLDGSVTGTTFNNMVSNLSVVVDSNDDETFAESAEGGVAFNYVSDVLQITSLGINIPANDSVNIAVFGDITGLEGQARSVQLSLTTTNNVSYAQDVSKSSDNIPFNGSQISIDLNAGAGTMTIASGANMPSGTTVPNDISNRQMFQFNAAVNNIELKYLDSLFVDWSGTMNVQTAVTSASLIADTDGDGVIDGGEVAVATTSSFSATQIRFVGGSLDSIAANTNRNYIVALTLNGSAISDETVTLSLDTANVFTRGQTSGLTDRVTFTSNPVNGNTFTIQNVAVASANVLSGSTEEPNVSALQIMDFNIISNAETSIFTDLTVRLTSSASQNTNTIISSAILFEDQNDNGIYDGEPTDSLIKGSAVLSGNNIIFSGFNGVTGYVNDTVRWIVQVNLNGSATFGSTLTASINASSQFILSQGNLSSDNFPLAGRQFTIRGIDMDFNAQALASIPTPILAGTEVEMAKFDVTRNSGPTTTTWTSLRVYNRSFDTEAASDIDSVKIYRINGVDTTLIGGNIMTEDGQGGFADVTVSETVPQGFDYLITYKVASGFNVNNGLGLQIQNESDFGVSTAASTINNLPYTSARDFSLPVSLAAFTGKGVKEGIAVTLQTASEPNLSTLKIKRTNNADGSIVTVRSIEVEGRGSSGNDYSFMDTGVDYNVSYTYTLEEVALDGSVYVHDISFDASRLVPETFAIGNAYPNPFNPVTNVNIELPERSRVDMTIYNTLGQAVRTVKNTIYELGQQTLTWNGQSGSGQTMPSGIYFMVIQIRGEASGKQSQRVIKLVMLK